MAQKYEPSLDGLRGLAVLAVMGFHFTPSVISGGSLGVDIFFVLSGYLITSILRAEVEDKGRVNYAAFLIRRARRLLPALFVLLIAYLALAPRLFPEEAGSRWIDVAAAAFYVTNLRLTFWPVETPLAHTWSLGIEEQFYLLWPIALLALARMARGSAATLLCGAWVLLTAARFVWIETIGGSGAYYFTPLHASGLLLGAALALRPISTSLGKIALALVIVILLQGRSAESFLVTQPIVEIATAIVIANAPTALASAPLRLLGRISYGVYLWHVPLMYFMAPDSWSEILILFLASIAAGALSFALVERWFLKPKSGFPQAPQSRGRNGRNARPSPA